jgi:Holliday junction DNA helicase RuvB
LIEKFGGEPVGLDNLAVSLGEDADTLEDMVEPFLIQAGFLTRTPQGRKANLRAYDHLGLRPKGGVNQQELL